MKLQFWDGVCVLGLCRFRAEDDSFWKRSWASAPRSGGIHHIHHHHHQPAGQPGEFACHDQLHHQQQSAHKHQIHINTILMYILQWYLTNKTGFFFLQVLPGIQMKQKTSKPGTWPLAPLLYHGHSHRSLWMDTHWSTRPKMKNQRWEKFYSTVE